MSQAEAAPHDAAIGEDGGRGVCEDQVVIPSQLRWLIGGVLAGAAGTASMTLAYSTEHRLRKSVGGPLDYDDSLVPGQIVASVLHLPSVTDREEGELGTALRWGYGSAFGLWHATLRRFVREPWASVIFGGTLMTATFTLFPLMGRTPPPWRWPAAVLATSIGTHVAYVSAAALVSDRWGRLEGRGLDAPTLIEPGAAH
jgi:hypothetical protein